MRRVLGHTWVGWANRLLLRWFFVRLTWKQARNGTILYDVHRWIWPFPWQEMRFVGGKRQ